jgi:hypothetical protein
MVEIERIPAEARWKLATHGLTGLPVAYNIAFRHMAGEQFREEIDEISRRIWSEAAKDQPVIAKAFGLPVNNAENISETFYTISKVFLGAELKGSYRMEEDEAVMTVSSCPFIKRARELGEDPKYNCRGCLAYCTSSVKNLNPDYELQMNKGMCAGDSFCEMRIKSKN